MLNIGRIIQFNFEFRYNNLYVKTSPSVQWREVRQIWETTSCKSHPSSSPIYFNLLMILVPNCLQRFSADVKSRRCERANM